MDDQRKAGLTWKVSVTALLMLTSVISEAQITSSGYATVEVSEYVVEYPDTTLRDNIYTFCNQHGNLTASLSDIPGDLTFEWSIYDQAASSYQSFAGPEEGQSSSVTGLESGGYRVRISNEDGLDTLFRAWVFVNRPLAAIDEERSRSLNLCTYLWLFGIADIDIFEYHHPLSGELFTLPVDYNINWTADDPSAIVGNILEPRVIPPPYITTEYTFKIDYYLCQASSSPLVIDPVATRPEFTIDIPDGEGPLQGEAPLEVIFDAGESLNASEYQWFFYYHPDTTNFESPDDFGISPMHTYYKPRDYYVMLRTFSADLCWDDAFSPEPVRVVPSRLEIANVFTPDGDGINDVFRVESASLRKFHGVIYNRNGRRVFEWTDPKRGWDGKIDGNNDASPGVYFYIITGVGWDDEPYKYTGPLHLFRDK